MKTIRYSLLFFLTLFLLSGCSSPSKTYDPDDPLEAFNRVMFLFNVGIDKIAFKPVAELYTYATPAPLRKGIYNVFNNANHLTYIANDILQLDIEHFLNDFARLAINSTVGLAGFFDVAEKGGFAVHQNDFGLTLANYGWKKSTYLVLPFWGPRTIRDALNIPADFYMSVYGIINFTVDRRLLSWILYGADAVRLRAELLNLEKLADVAALDRYSFERDLYLQRRHFLVQHGKIEDPYVEALDDEEDLYVEEDEEE